MKCKLPSLSLISVLTYDMRDWFLGAKLGITELPLNMKVTQLNFTQIVFTPNLTILRGESRRNYKSKIFFQIRTTLLYSYPKSADGSRIGNTYDIRPNRKAILKSGTVISDRSSNFKSRRPIAHTIPILKYFDYILSVSTVPEVGVVRVRWAILEFHTP